jgi:hypothetical protein
VGMFCLVSSDCDFTPLVLRQRADGKQVIGFDGQNAPAPFVNTVQLLLSRPRKMPKNRKVFAFTCLIRCGGCDSAIVSVCSCGVNA